MNERRYFSPEEKVKIVLEGLSGTVQVSELCRKYGITTTMFYNWKDKLIKSSPEVFENRGRKNRELQEEIAKLKDTIAEIATENLQLKKKTGSYRGRR